MTITFEEVLQAIDDGKANWAICRRIMKITDPDELKILFEKVEKDLFPRLNSSKRIKTFVPGAQFPAVSLTGDKCQLKCEHCKGKYLQGMIGVESPLKLDEVLRSAIKRGAKGFLISGGCDKDGRIPFKEFKNHLQEFKEIYDVVLNIHPGIMDLNEAFMLEQIDADFISFDFVIDDEIIKKIYHLKKYDYEDFMATYYNLLDTRIEVVPHILIGGKYGRIDRELDILKMIEEEQTNTLVFISMIPPKDDKKFISPNIIDIAKLILAARLKYPDIELALGCMRVRSKPVIDGYDLEKLAVLCGVERIAMPPRSLLQWATEKGIEVSSYGACCAMPKKLLPRFLDKKEN